MSFVVSFWIALAWQRPPESMPKTLSLIRHAKSSWKFPGLDDPDRPLNNRGARDAPLMAARYARRYAPGLIVSSFANRALTTARIFARCLGYPVERVQLSERVYEAGPEQLTEAIALVDDDPEHLALFGHNPGLTMLCNGLCDAELENIPTAGIAVLQLPCNVWSELPGLWGKHIGELLEFDYPKKTLGEA